MDQTAKINVDKYFNDYKKIYDAIMYVQNTLNGPLLDKIGVKAEKLFDEVTAAFDNNNGMTRVETIEFLKKLRTACLALVDLKNYLVGVITAQLEQIEAEKVNNNAVMNVQEIDPQQLVEQTTNAINELDTQHPVQTVDNTAKTLTLSQNRAA